MTIFKHSNPLEGGTFEGGMGGPTGGGMGGPGGQAPPSEFVAKRVK